MANTNDDPSDGFSVFLSGDSRRATDAPWRLRSYDRAGPLTGSQIADLALRFGLDADALGELSKSLGRHLNPSAHVQLIPASRSKGIEAANSDIVYARRQLNAMQSKLSAVIKRLSTLTSEEHFYDETPHSPPYAKMLVDLERSRDSMVQAEAILQPLEGPASDLIRWEPLYRLELRDHRRDYVLGAIFQFWVDAGRKLTFTTDPTTSKRRGELVEFSQAVCLLLTDPPTEIAAETIVKRILEKGKSYQPTPDWAKRFPTPEELRSVLDGSDE